MSDWVYIVRDLIGLVEVLGMCSTAIIITVLLKGMDSSG